MRIGTEKSATVHECLRSNRHDFLGMSLDENRASHELAICGQFPKRGFAEEANGSCPIILTRRARYLSIHKRALAAILSVVEPHEEASLGAA